MNCKYKIFNKNKSYIKAIIIFIIILAGVVFLNKKDDYSNTKLLYKDGFTNTASNEWWYINSFLKDEDGNEYGFSHVLFRDGTYQTILIDRSKKEVYTKTLIADNFDPYELKSTNYHWDNKGNGENRIFTDTEELFLDINFFSGDEKIGWGEDGYAKIGKADGYTYYYTYPEIEIELNIRIEDKNLHLKGSGQFDHQWGDWDYEKDFNYWEFILVNLDNKEKLYLARFWLDSELVNSFAYYRPKKNKFYFEDDFNIEVTKHDGSPDKWPMEWIFSGKFNGKKISLVLNMDFPGQFLTPNILDGVGKVEGEIDKVGVRGDIFVERVNNGNNNINF